MSKLKNCETCGTEFRTEKGKYCSKKCRPKEKHICIECSNEFFTNKKSEKYCSVECGKTFRRKKEIIKSKLKYPNGAECKICGLYSNALSFHLVSKHNLTAEEYKQKFSSPTCSKEYSEKISKNVSGEKNVWFNHGGKLSPFSKNNKKISHLTEEEKEIYVKNNIEKYVKSIPKENRSINVEYWLKRGYSKDEAKNKLKERQSTFSLEKCIKKYGEIDGLKKWQERQDRWHKSYKKSNYSKISQELFSILDKKISYDCVYAEYKNNGKNEEYVFKTKNGSVYKLDFYVKESNLIIEFDGDYWHEKKPERIANPKRIKNRDLEIMETNPMIKILHVKECDYKKQPEKVINECLNFLAN